VLASRGLFSQGVPDREGEERQARQETDARAQDETGSDAERKRRAGWDEQDKGDTPCHARDLGAQVRGRG
jgi:hypothetical protein